MNAIAAVHLVGALDAMRFADDGLAVALAALSEEAEERPGLDAFEVGGLQGAVGIFIALLAPAADAVRMPSGFVCFRRFFDEREEDSRNVPGLERAAWALDFATASLLDALHAFDDDVGAEAEWYGKVAAAFQVLSLMKATIEGSLVGRRGRGDAFGLN